MRWYSLLLEQFEQKQKTVIEQFGQDAWEILYSGYSQLLRDLNAEKIGGIVIYASRNKT